MYPPMITKKKIRGLRPPNPRQNRRKFRGGARTPSGTPMIANADARERNENRLFNSFGWRSFAIVLTL